ncbi:MAG: DUF3299 domain-containing protein [Pseudomonadota bacterium]
MTGLRIAAPFSIMLAALTLSACGSDRERADAPDQALSAIDLSVDPDAPAETIIWRDLLPDGELEILQQLQEGRAAPSLMSQFAGRDNEQIGTFNVVEELDGAIIRMPGYILPLDYAEAGAAREFLLLPYHGACIHYPPPPPNQIVYMRSAEPVRFNALWDPVWVEGRMQVEQVSSELADAAYSIAVRSVEPYEG